ncbi:CHC2 zinc finger domain-containing protein [Amycolatopsis sp. CA-128772]|uniref:CHC2 zinc finger domain-containing protein n=1 Tax=Amycolatopsis sp. CA-128772 TaxID=2073159 RepID=UPI000CD15B10|nr:CHC2 zinc finger domain-containing protein [Amycolatopsis sp. CA-128772]
MDVTAVSAPEPEPPGTGRIADLVAAYTPLSPLGKQQLRGNCPFCRSPMFRVRPRHNTFHCFSCGAGGDARMFAAKIGHQP